MSIFKKAVMMLASLAFFAIGTDASAGSVYLSQSGGTFGGGSACNGQSTQAYTFFNNSSNWGSGASQIGPGTIVWICGTITVANGTYALNVQGSGSSGSPVTIKFDTNAILQAGYFGGNPYTGGPGAITCSSHSYITVDGGANGIIQNTANGSASLGYGNQQGSVGIYFTCENFEVKNLTVQGIYVHAEGDNSGIGNTAGIFGDYDDTGCNIHDNPLIRDAYVNINIGYEASPPLSSCAISHNTLNYACHMIRSGDDGSNAYATNYVVSFNTMGPNQQTWEDLNTGCHSNGIFITNNSSGSLINGLVINGNTIATDFCSDRSFSGNMCSAFMQLAGTQSNLTVTNNVAYQTTTTGGFEAFVWLPTASSGGMSGTNVIANNVFDERNAGAGQSCSCAMIEWEVGGGGGGAAETGFIVKDNLFLNSSHEVYYNDDPGAPFSSKVSSISNNGFQAINGKMAHDNHGGTDYSTFASWTAAGFDKNSYDGNLELTSSYVPQSGSPVITLGANLGNLNIAVLDNDKNGVPRISTPGLSLASGSSVTSWAAGAYVVGSTSAPAPPSGVTAIVQ